jgi:hypothetical protein
MKRMRVTLEIPDWYPDNDDAKTVLDALLTAEGEFDSVASVVEVEWLPSSVCLPPVVAHQFQRGVCVWCGAPAEGDDNAR